MRSKIVIVVTALAVVGGALGWVFREDATSRTDLTRQQRRLAAQREKLGDEHPTTLTTMADLATDLRAAGDFAAARQLEEEVLAARLRTSGRERPQTLTAMHSLALTLHEEGEQARARELLEEVSENRRPSLGAEHPDTLTSLHDLAQTLYAQGEFQRARELHEEVLEIRRRVLGAVDPDTLKSMNNVAQTLLAQGRHQAARELHEDVLELRRRELGPDHPDTLTSMNDLAVALYSLGEHERALDLLEEVVRVRRRDLGPEHPLTLKARGNVAGARYAQGYLEEAGDVSEDVLELQRRVLGLDHPDTLLTVNNLASVLLKTGHHPRARELFEEAWKASERKLGAEHPDTLLAMSNFAHLLLGQGDVRRARELHEKVLEARRRELGEDHPHTSTSMDNLAQALRAQGETEKAQELFAGALELRRRKLGAAHPDTLNSMNNLALTRFERGDVEAAVGLLNEVFDTKSRELGADHPDTLMAKINFAHILRVQGKLREALELEEAAYAAQRRALGPAHPHTLSSRHNMATTFYRLKDYELARGHFEDLLRTSRASYGDQDEAEHPYTELEFASLVNLAATYQNLGQPERAAATYLRFLAALERRSHAVADSEDVRNSFKAGYEHVYRHTLQTLLGLKRTADAHLVLERFRAQGILAMLAEREMFFAEVPPELEERRRDIDARYDLATRRRGELDPERQKEAYERVLAQQEEIRRERERLHAELRRRAPSLADLRYPRPLTVDEIRRTLDPGTLALSFLVAPETTYLFVLERDADIVVHALDVDEATLEQQVHRFFEQLHGAMAGRAQASVAELASWLYKKLLHEVAGRVAASERLLVLPDGPLFYLPFSALVGPDGKYLVESRAVHTVVSATTYAELVRRRPASVRGPARVAAFGDPLYPAVRDGGEEAAPASAIVRRAVEREIFGGLAALPHSGREVAAIGRLYQSPFFVGAEATEERVKALDADVDVVHLAGHGVVDPYTPLDSFIALTISDEPGRDNGLLQAWEIYEHLRLDAGLVVLSACSTAVGPRHDGEGLIGLSRAFQIAGARTVVASLWSVIDESTAELMIRFHRHLRGGKTIDEALRAAQLELIRGPVTFTNLEGEIVERDYSSPHFWAPFVVIGDWK
jgi:CHAT domain-containing protein